MEYTKDHHLAKKLRDYGLQVFGCLSAGKHASQAGCTGGAIGGTGITL